MNFHELLKSAKANDHRSFDTLILLYRPLLVKCSTLNGVFDEDLYQELCITLLLCIRNFTL